MRKQTIERISLPAFFILAVLPTMLGAGYAGWHSLGLPGDGEEKITLACWSEVIASPSLWRSLVFSAGVSAVSVGLALPFFTILFLHIFKKENLSACLLFIPAMGLWWLNKRIIFTVIRSPENQFG